MRSRPKNAREKAAENIAASYKEEQKLCDFLINLPNMCIVIGSLRSFCEPFERLRPSMALPTMNDFVVSSISCILWKYDMPDMYAVTVDGAKFSVAINAMKFNRSVTGMGQVSFKPNNNLKFESFSNANL